MDSFDQSWVNDFGSLYARQVGRCKLQGREGDQYNPVTVANREDCVANKGVLVQYWVKIVFVDNQELLVKDAIRHTISDDMEVLEVDSAKEVIIIPMKQIKYLACDATVFATKKPS